MGIFTINSDFEKLYGITKAQYYTTKYFTLEAESEWDNLTFTIPEELSTDYLTSISYSTDDGENWTTVENENNTEKQITISTGNKVMFKGLANSLTYFDDDEGEWYNCHFSFNQPAKVYGNIMSLFYGDDFVDETEFAENSTHNCYQLFTDYDSEEDDYFGCAITDASGLVLPATSYYCYSSMFEYCDQLTTAPILPATTLTDGCYQSMFRGCTSLTEAPELPALTLVSNCYGNMFYNCTSLNYIKAMFTTTPSTSYTSQWVKGVAASGTFVMNSEAEWFVVNINGIPEDWATQYVGDSDNAIETKEEVISGLLKFTAIEDTTFTLTIPTQINTTYLLDVSYSVDNGKTWTKTANNANAVTITTPTVKAGKSVYWRGNGGSSWKIGNLSKNQSSVFSSTGKFNVSGNIMSMLADYAYDGVVTFKGNATCNFAHTFSGSKVQNASNLILAATTLKSSSYSNMFYSCTSLTTPPTLPATTLAEKCYYAMFSGCTSLTTAPALPVITLANSCYNNMFNGCTSLTTAPTLSATTLAESCYESMFYGCSSLAEAPELPATTLAKSCYYWMFKDCVSLTEAPALSATTLAVYCYGNMFAGCTSITEAPELPVTTLADRCYNGMFNGCTSLTTAPELPATTLTNGCYGNMFKDCTALTESPILPATTLITGCYGGMFANCTNLNKITALFTTTPSTDYTQAWVQMVSETGTFYKNENAEWDVSGNNGVPTGWTVATYVEE